MNYQLPVTVTFTFPEGFESSGIVNDANMNDAYIKIDFDLKRQKA